MRARIVDELKAAMKAKDTRRISTLRLVNDALKNRDIEARGQGKGPISDEELLGLLQKMIKQRQESAEIYDKAGRDDLATQEKEEIAIITSFLPQQLSEEEARAAISSAIASTGAQGMKDMGKVMAELRATYAGRMDFGKASGWLKELLK